VVQSRSPLWGFQSVTPPAQKTTGCSSPCNRAPVVSAWLLQFAYWLI
jgi:hypothetical protein